MRKIETAEELDKKKKRNARIGSIIMLLILVVSSLGYAFMSSEPSSNGGGGSGKIYEVGGRWALDVNGGTLYFSNAPENVSEIIVDSNLTLDSYYGKPLYVVSESAIVGNEIGLSLGKYVDRVQNACHGNCTLDLPEKSCNDNLIVYNEKNNSRVYQSGNCVFIEGDLRAVDAFLYKILVR